MKPAVAEDEILERQPPRALVHNASGSPSNAGRKSGAWSISRESNATRASTWGGIASDLRRGPPAAMPAVEHRVLGVLKRVRPLSDEFPSELACPTLLTSSLRLGPK
jgi:hypothetical protein